MEDPISLFTPVIGRNIELTKRLTLELYKISGQPFDRIEKYAEEQLVDNYGIMIFNYVEFTMVAPYVFLWKLHSSHTEEELPYIDANRMAEHLKGLLEMYLSERFIDDVEILLFKAIKSNQVGVWAKRPEVMVGRPDIEPDIELVSDPAKVRSNTFDLPTGQTVTTSSPAEPITEKTATGYANILYQITEATPPQVVPLYYMIVHHGNDTGDIQPDDFRASFEDFIARNFMPGTKLGDVFLADAEQEFYIYAPQPVDTGETDEPAVDPTSLVTRTAALHEAQLAAYFEKHLTAMPVLSFEDFTNDPTMPYNSPQPVTYKGCAGIAMVVHGGYMVAYSLDIDLSGAVCVDFNPGVDVCMVNDFISRITNNTH